VTQNHNLTNEEALDALKIFEECQTENLNFKLKYAMARNVTRLKPVKKALDVAKDVSNDDGCKAFLIARKKFLEDHKGQENDPTYQADFQRLQEDHSDAITHLENKENEVRDWLGQPVEGVEIFKISAASFPAETTINLGKIFAFISEE
jgi:hypothetical protein